MANGKKRPKLNAWERFFVLLYQIMGLIMSGARDIEWLVDKFQTILSDGKPTYQISNTSPEDDKQIVDHWNKHFPRRAWSIVQLIGRFYSADFPFLREPNPKIEWLAKKAFYWRDVKGVRTISASEAKDPDKLSEFIRQTKENIGLQVGPILLKQFRDECSWTREKPFEDNWWNELVLCLDDAVGTPASLEVKVAEAWGKKEYPPGVVDFIVNGVIATAECAVALQLAGSKYDLTGLLLMWRAGNLPLGFDYQGNLLVLYGEPGEWKTPWDFDLPEYQ